MGPHLGVNWGESEKIADCSPRMTESVLATIEVEYFEALAIEGRFQEGVGATGSR